MIARHSPGPWREDPHGNGLVLDAGGMIVASTFPAYGDGTQEANRALIAAAPDMLAALRAIMLSVAGCQTEDRWQAARAAIAKAEGR